MFWKQHTPLWRDKKGMCRTGIQILLSAIIIYCDGVFVLSSCDAVIRPWRGFCC